MKQTTRLLALSALVLAIMLGVFGAPALEAPSVAFAQGQVPAAPTGLTATRSGASTINLSWNTVTGAVRYQVYSWDAVDEWQRLDGGAANPHTTNTFAHQNLVADRLYYYQVYAVNAAGDRGPRSNRANEVAGQNAPGRPVLTPTPGYQVNVISWPMVSGAASYVLYAWDQSWSQVGGTITGTSYTHTGLTVGRTYYYEARAVNSGGVMGAYSAQVSATVLSTPTITAPVNLSAGTTPQDQQVTLTWQAPPGAGSTITGYEYRYAESTASLPATWTSAGTALTVTITGLTNGTQYTFEVRAMSSTGEGPAASVMATPADEPDAPVLTATEGYRLVMLSWDAPNTNGAAITAYHVEILNTQNQWVAETSVPGTSTSYTDSGLNDSTVYTYRVIAENAAGRSSASNSDDATTLAQPAQVPGAPTLPSAPTVVAVSGPGMVTLNWQAPLFNGGSPITGYEYRYKLATASSYGGWMSAMMELTVDVKPLTPLMEYDFEVRARNSVGPGPALEIDDDPPAAAAARTPGATGPTAVPSLRQPSLGTHDGTVAPHESNATITVSWVALGPAVNGGSAITGYELCYKKLTDSAWMRWTGTGFGDPTLTGSVYNAVHGATGGGELDPGTTYQYRARAYNAVEGVGAGTEATCDHWDGAWSNVVSATTPVVEPAAPTLHAAAGDTTTTPPQAAWTLNVNSITIRWTPPTDTGGADVTAYEVWVGTATVTDADAIAALTPTVTGLPSSRTEYISIGLRAETQYFYRVRARNGSGADRVSVWSTEQAGTTTVTVAGTPGPPTAASGSHTAGDVTVTWTAPANQGTSPITSYEVQYQRTDDTDDDAADLADWSDAATATPTPPTALTWTHMQAPGNSTYVYRVRAVNGSGAGAWSDASAAVTVTARAPAAPTLTATAVGPDEIMLQWNIPESNGTDITGFSIQQWDATTDPANPAWSTTNLLTTGGAGGGDISNDATLTVFIVGSLDAGTKYYYRIQALPGGDWSATNMADAASDTTMSGVPAMPTLTVGDGTTNPPGRTAPGAAPTVDSISLYWEAPASGGSDILGYQIRVWDGSDWALEDNLAATATMYKDEGLAPGTRYYYILAARNSSGYGKWSDAASGMTAAGNPDAPVLNAVATSGTSIQLTWTVPKANGATITGYQLVRWDASTSAWGTDNLLTGSALANTDAETVTEFEDTGLMAGTKYYYRIRALPQLGADGNADADAGWSATDMSDATSETTHGDTPGRPTWPTAAFDPTASSLVLVWEAPTATGGSDITGYELEIWSSGRWVDETTLGNVLTYTDMSLAAGTKYYYRVRAINGQGAGLWSATKAGTTTAGSPDAPVLTATPAGMTAVRLTWTVPNDNGTPITSYVLQRWDSTADPAAWGTANLLGDTAADTIRTLFVDSGRMPGVTYYYRIRALPQTGGDNVGWSTIKSATTDPGAPDRPVLTATPDGQNAVDLSWTKPMDNGSAIVRYEVQVWNTATSMWDYVRNDLPSTRTTYKHGGRMAGTKYVYRVRAVNRAADNNGLGKWSVIKFADTAE